MAAEAQSPLHFSRFEFKYVLDRPQREEVEAELRHFVELDPFVREQPDHHYFVRSLYFDDAALSAHRAKEDGMLHRAKFRVRTYARTAADPAPWYLELKGRHDQLVFKHRTPLQEPLARHAAGDALTRMVLQRAAPGAVRDQFEFARFQQGLRPIALVDYLRRPYVSRFDPEFRLTFDSQLTATATDAVFPPASANQRGLLRGYTVMEVKFRRTVPAWFHRILQAYQLRRRSVSKICTAVRALGLYRHPE